MSFDSEYLELRKKRKEREQQRLKEISEQQNINTQTEEKLDFFQKGVFDDGYQAGDISKAILGTVGDTGLSLLKGMSSLGEGLLDTVGYAAAGVADLLGKKGWADDIKRYTQDSYTDDMFYIPNAAVEDKSVLGRTSQAILEGVGQAAGIVATAGVGGAAGLSTKGVTALTSTVTGLSGFGSGMSEAYQSGATDEEAVTYGMISAASDVLTEMLFGGLGKGAKAIGISKGLSSADDMLAKKVSNMFSNQIIKNLSEFGIKAGAEGIEEVLSGVTQAVGKKLTYMSEKDLKEILKDENLLEQFIVGMASSGFMQAGDVHNANKTKTDFITGFSQNEQSVVDKVYKDKIAEATKDGKKLSSKNKSNIYDSVLNDLEKGYIGIDTIESVLGGETYKQYQSAVEKDNQMKELQKEYDTLYKMKNGEKSDEQNDRQKELKQQLYEYKNTSKLSDIQKQLSNEVSELAKTSKLAESYNEKARRSQAFEADLTKYEAKAQETVKRAIDSGVLNNTNRTHEFVDMIAKLSADKGVLFDFTNNTKLKESGFAIEGKQVNGYVQGNNIAINIDSTSALNKVVGHEITHILEGTELYTELVNAVKELATTKGEYDSKLQSITKLYEGVEDANIENELTADLIGEYLFTDSDFINRLSAEKPTLFQKIFDEIKYLCKVATAGSKEARQLEKVKKTFEEAYRQKNNTVTDDGVKYSMAGVKSKTHDFSALEQAIRLEDVGKATSEEIRQQTGWYRGYDGEWRYEINDKDMKIKDVDITSGETKLGDVLEHQELFDAYPELKEVTISAFPSILKPYTNGYYNKIDNEISLADYFLVNTKVEKELDEIKSNPEYKAYIESLKNAAELHGKKRLELAKEFKEIQKTSEYEAYIDDYFNSDSSENAEKVIEEWKNSDIGKRYEEIKAELSRMDKTNPKTEIENQFRESGIGKRYYELINNIDTSEITNNAETRKTLIHEIQHAIQHIERFANGSSVEYWAKAPVESKPGTLAYAKSVRKKLGEKILSSASPEFVQAFREYNRGDIEYSDIENGNFTEEELDMLWDYDEADREVAYLLEHKGRTDEDLYYSTAGEIEARDTSKRLNYSDEQRKNTRPDIDRTDVVFAGDSGIGYSVEKTVVDTKGNQYNDVVKVNTDIFKEYKPRNWKTPLKNFVDNHLIGKKITIFNKDGESQTVEFAKPNERVTNENGNRRKVIDKLKQKNDRNSQIAVANIENLVEVSFEDSSVTHSEENNHQWLDANGWDFRFAYMEMPNGKIYSVQLNIANTADGRKILYDINKISECGLDTMLVDETSTASQNSQFADKRIPQEQNNVKKNSLSNANDDVAPVGNGKVYGEDIKLQSASAEDIAPTAEDIKNQNTLVINDAPMKENQSATHNELVNQMSDIMDENPISFNKKGDIADTDPNVNIKETDEIKRVMSVKGELRSKLFSYYNELHNNESNREKALTEKDELISKLQAEYDGKKDKNSQTANKLLMRIEKEQRLKNNIDAEYSKNISKIEKQIRKIENKIDKLTPFDDELEKRLSRIDSQFEKDKAELKNEFDQKKADLKKTVSSKGKYISEKSLSLYREMVEHNKGEQVSKELKYFLDMKFEWNTLKSTLVAVNNNPLNPKSDFEKLVYEAIGRDYERKLYELDDLDSKYFKQLAKLENEYDEKRKATRRSNQAKLKKLERFNLFAKLAGDTSTWKDKKSGYAYSTETEKRNFRDVVRKADGERDIERADALYDELQGKYNENESLLKKEEAEIKQKYIDLKINKYESQYIHMVFDKRYNPKTVIRLKEVSEFYDKHKKKINTDKVEKAIAYARADFEMFFVRRNDVLRNEGMKEIPYHEGYIPHFYDDRSEIGKILDTALNWKVPNKKEIPTDIAGLTKNFKPNKSWQAFAQEREGERTEYNFLKVMDTHIHGSLDWIYHIPDIQNRRAFENYLRLQRSENGIQDKFNEIYSNEEYDANEMQEQIDLLFKEAENPLGNFVIDLRKRTNSLVGKRTDTDREWEQKLGKNIYSFFSNISNRVSSNAVVGSISAALTNFIPITQSWGEVSPKSSLRAMRETIKSAVKDDGTVEKSVFLTNRLRNPENLYKTFWDKSSDVLGFFMEIADNFTSQTVWRSKYLENVSNGMSESEAIKNADEFAEGLIAGRSRGNMPTIFDSKNPVTKMFTAFQLEVNNQYRYLFKDLPQNLAEESKLKLTKAYLSIFVGAYAYNALYSAFTGRDAAFDPFRIIQELLGELFDDEEDEPADVIMDFTDNIIDELPFVGGILGDGGRVPISSALPYGGIREAWEGSVTDFTNGNYEDLTEEWLFSAGAYGLAPMGGGQIKKTVQGLSMFDDDLPVAGSYTDSGKLRFTVDETMDEMIKAGLFGQYASNTARQYFDEERAPLSDKQTKELVDLDIPIADYWKYRDGLKALGEDATLSEKVAYIADLEEFDTRQKNIMANNLTTRKDPIDLTDYDKYGDLEELDYAVKNPGKYAVSKAVGGYSEYVKYSEHLNNITSEKNAKGETVSGSRKIKVTRYINNLDIDYGEKIILYRSQYKSDDTYNTQIIDYLNSRDDISREEMETILKELGFEVYADGTVRW